MLGGHGVFVDIIKMRSQCIRMDPKSSLRVSLQEETHSHREEATWRQGRYQGGMSTKAKGCPGWLEGLGERDGTSPFGAWLAAQPCRHLDLEFLASRQ